LQLGLGESSSLKSTFGWARIEVLGSLFSLVFLGSLSFATSIECLQTLFHSGHLDTMHLSFGICVLAGVHFAVWVIIFLLIGGKYLILRKKSEFANDSLLDIGYSHQQSDAMFKRTQSGELSLQVPTNKPKDAFMSCNLDQVLEVPFKHVFRDLAGHLKKDNGSVLAPKIIISTFLGCFMLLLIATLAHVSHTHYPIPYVKYIDPCIALLSILILGLTRLDYLKMQLSFKLSKITS
jgi:Co/Zn/Cd efflux system component